MQHTDQQLINIMVKKNNKYALPITDADGHQHGTVDQLAALAHPLVVGKDIRRFIERALAPDGQTGVQLFGSTTDRGGPENSDSRISDSLASPTAA